MGSILGIVGQMSSGKWGIILCIALLQSACTKDASNQSSDHYSELQKQTNVFLDQAVSQDKDVAVQGQRELVKLCRETPNGFEVITEIMEQRVEENPSDLTTAKLLKEIYLRELHDPDRAVEVYEDLVKHDPANVQLKQELVQLYQATKRYDDVVELYQREIGTGSGNDDWLRFQVASHMIYAGQAEEGLEYARQFQGDEPSAENLERLSRLYETANQWDAASQELQKAIQVASNEQHSANMSIHMGELYIRSQQYEEALDHLTSLKKSPALNQQQKSVVNEQIFRIYKKQGRLSELNIGVGK